MVKLTTSILSSISGTTGSKHTYKTKKNGTIVLCKNPPIPKYTRTNAQDTIRKNYKKLASLWKDNIKYNDKIYNNLSEKQQITGYNKFLSIYRKLQSFNPYILYGLDEGEGIQINDYTYNNINGTLSGGQWTKNQNQKNEIYFNGEKQYINSNNLATAYNNKNITSILITKNIATPTAYSTLLSGKFFSYWFEYRNNKTLTYSTFINGHYTTLNTQIDLSSSTNMLSFSYDGQTLKGYINNNKIAERGITGTLDTPSNNYTISSNRSNYSKAFNSAVKGTILGAMVFKHTLTEQQIQSIYSLISELIY